MRVSRKNKSFWRKKIDTSDVEMFLEEQREDERVGNVDEKLDSELFLHEDTSWKKINLNSIRKEMFKDSPKFCSSLQNTSNVTNPILKRNLKNYQIYGGKDSELLGKKVNNSIKTSKANIWENEVFTADKSEWLNDAVILQNRKLIGTPLAKSFPINPRQSTLPNVEIPKPGASYNPGIDDYNELKATVINKEKNINKTIVHLDRVITSKFIKMPKQDRHVMIWNEMSEGLVDNEANQDTMDNEHDGNYKPINQPVRNRKKDRKAKNKKRRAVFKRNVDAIVKTELKKCSDIERISEFNSELNNREAIIRRKQRNRSKRLKEKQMHPPRISYLKFEESEADFAEPLELPDSLRTVAPNKSLIVDRFKSLQKRAMIAPKKHRDGILRCSKSYMKRWKRYTKSDYKGIDN